jgi:hypothetical protein
MRRVGKEYFLGVLVEIMKDRVTKKIKTLFEFEPGPKRRRIKP